MILLAALPYRPANICSISESVIEAGVVRKFR